MILKKVPLLFAVMALVIGFSVSALTGGGGGCSQTNPDAVFASASNSNGVAPYNVTFDATGSAAACDSTITNYSWDLGDGSTASGSTVDHTFVATGAFVVELEVTDALGTTSSYAREYTIRASNAAPTATDDQYTFDYYAGGEMNFNVLTNDSDSDGDNFWIIGNSTPETGYLSLDRATGNATYRPNSFESRIESFTYTVVDDYGAEATATVNITIPQLAPVTQDESAGTPEDIVLSGFTVLFNDTDPNGDELTATLATAPLNGSVTVNSDGTYSYSPNVNFNGSDSFTYYANDGYGNSTVGTVSIEVYPRNDAPTAASDSAIVDEDSSVNVAVLTNDGDIDGDQLAVINVSQPTNGSSIVNADGSVTYTPNANYYGSDSFTYTLGDGNGGQATATVNVTVNSVNDAPVASFTYSVGKGGRVSFNASSSSDTDGTIASYQWNFSDGSTASGVTAQKRLKKKQSIAVTLTVIDDNGLSSATNQTISL